MQKLKPFLLTIAIPLIVLIMEVYVPPLPVAVREAEVWQAIQADAAGSDNLAEFYLAISDAIRQRAIETEAAQYAGWATFYAHADEPNRQICSVP